MILVPTALAKQWGLVAHQVILTRSFENGGVLAYANHAGTENGLSYLGASFIAAPYDVILARASAIAKVIIAKIAKSRVKDAQNRLPYHRDVNKIQLHEQCPIICRDAICRHDVITDGLFWDITRANGWFIDPHTG